MSELIQHKDNRATIRWKLLTGASALVLAVYASSTVSANAEDAGRPLLWIEVGADVDAIDGTNSPFVAPFLQITPTPDTYKGGSPLDEEKSPRFSIGGDLSLTFQPSDSDWVFSAGIKYGRSHKGHKTHHQKTDVFQYQGPLYTLYHNYLPSQYYPPYLVRSAANAQFVDTKVNLSERHMVLDFQAGKDVGLGLFGGGTTSVLSGGIRMARFSSHSDVTIRARPEVTFQSYNLFGYVFPYFETNFSSFYLAGQAKRSFHGIGPMLSWSSSVPVAGNSQDGALAIDWGITGAVLFGRQKAKVSHRTAGYYFSKTKFIGGENFHTLYKSTPAPQNRSRSVTVPSLGASIGLSYRYQGAKLSLGYRYDTFLNAMDTGIDKTQTSDVSFNGLYASISIGIGD